MVSFIISCVSFLCCSFDSKTQIERLKLQNTLRMQAIHTQYLVIQENEQYNSEYTALDREHRTEMGNLIEGINELLLEVKSGVFDMAEAED